MCDCVAAAPVQLSTLTNVPRCMLDPKIILGVDGIDCAGAWLVKCRYDRYLTGMTDT
jgi:hypothetical protein